MALTHEQVLGRLQSAFGESILTHSLPYGMLKVEIPSNKNVDVVKFLKEDPELQFNYLTDLCGVHFPNQKGREVGVVMHMHSFVHNYRIRIVYFMPEQNTEVDTISNLFAGANWMERETYDFFGIRFNGHPDMRRILNVDHMEMFPLLKQYPLEDSSREDKDDRFFGR